MDLEALKWRNVWSGKDQRKTVGVCQKFTLLCIHIREGEFTFPTDLFFTILASGDLEIGELLVVPKRCEAIFPALKL